MWVKNTANAVPAFVCCFDRVRLAEFSADNAPATGVLDLEYYGKSSIYADDM
jgi:hypothetical protein